VCGKPAVVTLGGWEPLFSTHGDPDPSEVYFCEEHWVYLNEEGSITTISPVDETSQPPEEAFTEVFRAATVLFSEKITDEDLIIPTLAFANQASARPELEATRGRFAEVAGDPERREKFSQGFRQKFKGLEPESLSDDVLILRGVPVSLALSMYPDTGILKEIEIDVFMRSVKPEEVASLYKLELDREGISYNEPSEGSFVFRGYVTHLSMVVGPGKHLNADQTARLSSIRGQLTFPPPELVRDFYAGLKGSVYRGRVRGFVHVLRGRQSGEATRADNLIPACVAWYLRECGGITDNHRLARLLNRELLTKCGKPGVEANSGQAMWKSIESVGHSIKWAEVTLQTGL